MVGFNEFLSIALDQCGSDRETFAQLVEVWNREEQEIRSMTASEIRENLRCP